MFPSDDTYSVINIQSESDEPSVDFQKEMDLLLALVEQNKDNKFWLKDTVLTNTEVSVDPNLFLSSSNSPDAWSNKNTLFYDIRVTLALYLNHIKHALREKAPEDETEVLVPFHWVDWIDLTALNLDLAVPLSERRNCEWFKDHIDLGKHFNMRHLGCFNNNQLTPEQVENLGFSRHDQLPGFVIHGYSLNRGTIDVRLAQARSYVMTHMPVPFKLVFLNSDNGTYEVNVHHDVPKQLIINSDLMDTYLQTNTGGEVPKKLNLDPVKEFKALKDMVKPIYIDEEFDNYGLYGKTHSIDEKDPKILDLPQAAFNYGPENVEAQIQLYKSLEESLGYIQQSFLESLEYSRDRKTNEEWVFFRQSTLWYDHDDKNKDNDRGWHYDWRFFTGTLNGIREGWTDDELKLRQEVILDRLTRNWFRFSAERGFVSWIMHGPLLSWYWDGLMFPFDNDIDIQMPIQELVRLGKLYNQTLVIEDVEEGFGKYLIDVGTFIHNRDISRRENHIDARFIDVDSGIYIDITGISTSDVSIPDNYEKDKAIIKISQEQKDKPDNPDPIYNDRRKHFHKYSQISPLKYSRIGGVPAYLPNDIASLLLFEYPKGMIKAEYNNWHYIPKINLWVHKDKIQSVFDDNDYKRMMNGKNVKTDKFKLDRLILHIEEEEIIKLLKQDADLLCEYYKTKDITETHEIEKKFLFSIEAPLVKSNNPYRLLIQTKQLAAEEMEDYSAFVNQHIKMPPPLRKSLYQYENIDQPLHHHEYVSES